MPDERHLDGLDPYAILDGETERLDAFFTGLETADWRRPSRCAGWSTRDVLAHMAASEEYNAACLDGSVGELLSSFAARGVTDLAGANDLGVRELAGDAPEDVLRLWRTRSVLNRAGLRARDGGEIATSVGPYPARWQAFHLAFEVAVHADDVGCPVPDDGAARRRDWMASFGRFVLTEYKPGIVVEARDGTNLVQGEGVDVDLPDAEFVQAVAARLPDDHPLDTAARALLSATP